MLRMLGWLLGLAGLSFVLGAVATSAHMVAGVVGLLLGGGGLALARVGGAGDPQLAAGRKVRERKALKQARESAGLLGAAALAAQGNMTFEEAHDALESLAKQGACETVVTEEGAVCYRFPDFARLAQKEAPKLLE